MTFHFSGFIIPGASRQVITPELACEYTVRSIDKPIAATLIAFRHPQINSAEELEQFTAAFGLSPHQPWLYLDYLTWAGSIDRVWAAICRTGTDSIDIEEDDEAPESLFLEMMGSIGIDRQAAMNFKPFHRGYFFS